MNPNHIRTAVIGLTAGVTAGAVTVATIIAIDNYDPLGKLTHAVAYRRLSPADRTELDRRRADRAAAETDRLHTRDTVAAATRAGFQPPLLLIRNRCQDLTELTVPALIEEIERAVTMGRDSEAGAIWTTHLNALVNEFGRRRGWNVRSGLSELDQLRLEAAEKLVSTAQFVRIPQAAIWQPSSADGALYPDFSGPYATETTTNEE
ncbi:hypothetical protein OHB26_09520 [Nocardia sp. NBC_01503]|uniref:hypothetical protein n=1 Tax=Nocardia sp. NBC_01503 TaxID=2975997 RepID=UPI002E7C4B15|nr:hypothetical protein [Nocardia sp. NBC_01503]WTL34414.1 hypothetical protein OHB26_09520 [Nocardia sp. NBC_01503]